MTETCFCLGFERVLICECHKKMNNSKISKEHNMRFYDL